MIFPVCWSVVLKSGVPMDQPAGDVQSQCITKRGYSLWIIQNKWERIPQVSQQLLIQIPPFRLLFSRCTVRRHPPDKSQQCLKIISKPWKSTSKCLISSKGDFFAALFVWGVHTHYPCYRAERKFLDFSTVWSFMAFAAELSFQFCVHINLE